MFGVLEATLIIVVRLEGTRLTWNYEVLWISIWNLLWGDCVLSGVYLPSEHLGNILCLGLYQVGDMLLAVNTLLFHISLLKQKALGK